MTVPNHDEWDEVAEQFGVDLEQVRRDHLISHVLAALTRDPGPDRLIFFGGTALARTYLPDARLSEDIDLISRGPRSAIANSIQASVRRGLARSHGRPEWRPALSATSGSQAAVLQIEGVASIQVQLVGGDGYSWPTEVRDIDQRYSDAPAARLRTLTAAGFAAAKLSAWMDRGAPRDLYDLWALAERGLVDREALEVFIRLGPHARPPTSRVFATAPAEGAWRVALGHQTRLRVTASEALERVRESWRAAEGQ